MAFLGLALFAEGPTDYRFLGPVLRRLCEGVCAAEGRTPVEVGEVLELQTPQGLRDAPRADRIAAAAREAMGGWHILFVHADGDRATAREERVDPACEAIRAEFGNERHWPVAVVPVRETEAWALADGDALRAVLGTIAADAVLGLPRAPQTVEKIPNPKQKLEEVCRTAQGGRKGRRRRKTAALLEAIGERVSLDVLSHVPAFQELQGNLREALASLGYLA